MTIELGKFTDLVPEVVVLISEFNEANMKIAFNVEYRFKIIGKLDGAIFTDIGNILECL